MSTTLIEVRRAKPSDARAIATTHDDAWRCAYQGIIPGPELDKLINRRGPVWWDAAVRKGSRIVGLDHPPFHRGQRVENAPQRAPPPGRMGRVAATGLELRGVWYPQWGWWKVPAGRRVEPAAVSNEVRS